MEDQINFYEMKLRFETDSWDLFEELNSSKNVIVIDARSPEAFAKEHIPGAVNMPHRTMSEETPFHSPVSDGNHHGGWFPAASLPLVF
ncbi:MAG: hypothetical protein H6968_01740 [Chromatiaceae bacterium]|nr:hypothetical protein [Chromatiaceae bacterium]